MAIALLTGELIFPDPSESEDDGLLAVGGDLSPKRLLLAYQQGIFPWFSGDLPMWYCPDPRFVLYPDDLIVSRSMRNLLKKNTFSITVNTSFNQVIMACRDIYRPSQSGTWITHSMVDAYCELHRMGLAVSVEAWKDGLLAGGLYGIRLGNMFFGESMFSKIPNASKYAFIRFVDILKADGVTCIDCQVYTEHLESLGARMIPREEFLQYCEGLRKGDYC